MSSSIASENTNASEKDKEDEVPQDGPDSKKRSASDADLSSTNSTAVDTKVAARREANRMHALKSRQRSKALLEELQGTVSALTRDKADLERQNAVLRAQVEVLSQQNRALFQSQQHLFTGIQQPSQGMQTVGSMQADSNPQQQQLLGNPSQTFPQAHTQHPNMSQSSQQGQMNEQQLNHQLFAAAAYNGATIPGFSGFLQQPLMLDPNAMSFMQSLQQVQMEQQRQQQENQQQSLLQRQEFVQQPALRSDGQQNNQQLSLPLDNDGNSNHSVPPKNECEASV